MMKTRFLFLAILFAFLGNVAIAQDAEEAITDDELTRYAEAMDSVERMKETLMDQITEKVENNELIANSRYNELSKIINDEEKLKAAGATPEEISFVKEITVMKEEGAKSIKDTFMTMAKEYITAPTYNKISKALKSDPEVKKRYQVIFDEISKDEEGSDTN